MEKGKSMFKKKILVTAIILGVALSTSSAFADPIVELAAPRVQSPKVIPDVGSAPQVSSKPKADTKAKQKAETSKTKKKHRLHVRKKPIVIKLDYGKISKLIEYGYYDYADKTLENALSRNKKDLKAKTLWIVSQAKQCKLETAQEQLDNLLPKYPNNADLHYAQGIVYYQRTASSNMLYRNKTQQLLNNAMNEFKKAIKCDGSNPRAYNAVGVISVRLQDYKTAQAYFQKSIAADPTYSTAIDNLGTMNFINNKFKDAEKNFKQALVYNTANTTAMYHLAQVAIQKKDYDSAIYNLNNALAIEPNSPAIYNLLGRAYEAQGNEAAAINAYKQSIRVKPEFTLSYTDLAGLYQQRGDNELALEQLKSAVAVDPNYYEARLMLADVALVSGKYRQSIDAYGQLVGVSGYNSAALKGLANAYYGEAQVLTNKSGLGSDKDLYYALECINKAAEANNATERPDLELHLAQLKLSKLANQPDLTKVELQKIINSPTTELMSTILKAEAYLALNDYPNADKTFEAASGLTKTPDEDLALGELLTYHKQFKNAENVLTKVIKNDPDNKQAIGELDYLKKCQKYADNYFSSAKYFLRTGNSASAIEYLNRSLSVNPNNAQAHLLLAKLYEQKKDYQNAINNYKAYQSLSSSSYYSKCIKAKIRRLDNKL